MAIKIALAGNPNCGKTTLFNALTGSNQFVGNWPGVTVEKKEGKLKFDKEVSIIDLPGIYSLSPYTLEEIVARNYLISEKIDAIINIVDGTNMERNLYLSTQLMELGIPMVMAVNMMDIVEKNGDKIYIDKLGKKLGCEVVEISALKNTGIEQVAQRAVVLAKTKKINAIVHKFTYDVEQTIDSVKEKLGSNIKEEQKRFFAIKLLEKDNKILEQILEAPNVEMEVKALEEIFDDDTESIITNERYIYISSIIGECITRNKVGNMTFSDRIDQIVTNRILALPIFAVVMFLIYYISITTIGGWATDWVNDGVFGDGWHLLGIENLFIPSIPNIISNGLDVINCAAWLKGLIIDGIIAGVGAVLGFVPQMLVLFFFLAFLEACGYMARVAFIMDRIFRRFGLSGKSFIPIMIGTGCGVPGIMASRTIENERDRRMAVITTTFIPCGAKLPIIALIAGAFFGNSGWISWSAYMIGIVAIICSGIILKKTKMFAGDPAPFIMELPSYHMPGVSSVLHNMWERGWSFIKKASTIILLSTIFIWFTTYFGWIDGKFRMLEDMEIEHSILAGIGSAIAWLFKPLGWGDWKSAVAAFTGLVAKENVVATFGILFNVAEVSDAGEEIWGALAGNMTALAAYSYLVFNLLCAPCFAAMGAIKREMNNIKWFWFAIAYQSGLAYLVAFVIYQIGMLTVEGIFGIRTVIAFLFMIGFFYLLFRPSKKSIELKIKMVANAR